MYRFAYILLLFLIPALSSLSAKDIAPALRLEASGFVSDFVVDGNRLYAATDEGSVDIFDLGSGRVVERIILEPVQLSSGDSVPARIYSVDRKEGKTLMVSRGKNGYRNVWIHQQYSLRKLFDEKDKLFPKEARFIDGTHILMGTFGSDIVLYDVEEKYHSYKHHISDSTMGDIDIAEEGKFAFSDESGAVHIVDTRKGEVEKVLKKENRDNIYRVAYRHGTVVTAGEDRRVGVYLPNGDSYHLKSNFLVYCVALSPGGDTAAYADGVEQDIQLFDIDTKRKKERLTGQRAIINKILFLNEKIVISSADSSEILVWQLP